MRSYTNILKPIKTNKQIPFQRLIEHFSKPTIDELKIPKTTKGAIDFSKVPSYAKNADGTAINSASFGSNQNHIKEQIVGCDAITNSNPEGKGFYTVSSIINPTKTNKFLIQGKTNLIFGTIFNYFVIVTNKTILNKFKKM